MLRRIVLVGVALGLFLLPAQAQEANPAPNPETATLILAEEESAAAPTPDSAHQNAPEDPESPVPSQAPPPEAPGASALAPPGSMSDLEDLLFKELPQPVVTSATKKEQPIYEAPSSITVITAEDIRRMGARRLVDVFRWTPGLDVFLLSGNRSSVSVRGVYSLHNKFINEVLVLIDGRTAYMDFFGGVDWDTLPVLLEEIERIEIIRGPSGSLYGPNAFAGTISIFTKRKPEDGLIHTTVGRKHFFETNLVDWIEGENYKIRFGIGWREDEGFGTGGGRDFRDDVNFLRMNSYGHFTIDEDTDLELRGGWLTGTRGFEAFDIDARDTEDTDVPYGQISIERRFSEEARFHAQYYHNHFDFDRDFLNGTKGLETWTDVILLEQFWRVHPRHQLIFGGEFRNFVAHSGLTDPERIEENFRSLFIEDDVTLVEEKLNLILGLRYDDFTISGDDFSPRAALVWTPAPQHSFRASLARSIATPMTVASQLSFTAPAGTIDLGPPFGVVPIISETFGNSGLNPESIMAYEIGYRGRWTKKLDVGADLFLYDIADLMRVVFGTPALDPTIPALVSSNTLENEVDTLAWGGELSITYQWSDSLRTFFGYGFKDIPDVTTTGPFTGLENSKNSLFGAFDFRFCETWILSGRMAWNDGFAMTPDFVVDDYLRFDVRLAKEIWEGRGTIEFVGQNLLDPEHPESDVGVEVPRLFYAGLEVRY